MRGRSFKVMHLSKSDPRLADALIAEHRVEMEIAELQASYDAQRPDADPEKARSKVRELVEKRFDLRQQRLTMEIEGMRKRLDEAMARLSQQAANRAQLIEAEARRTMDRLEAKPHARQKRQGVEGGEHPLPEMPPPGANQ